MQQETTFKPRTKMRVQSSTSVTALWVIVAAVTAWLLLRQYRLLRKPRSERELIPSLREKWKHLWGIPTLIPDAYSKLDQATFHYTTFRGNHHVVLCTSKLIDELKSTPAETLSFTAWVQRSLELDTLFPLWSGGSVMVHVSSFSSRIVFRWYKGVIMRDLPKMFPFIREALQRDLTHQLVTTEKPVLEIAGEGIVGVVARFLMGEKLSQDPELLKLMPDVTKQIAVAGLVASLFPKFLKSTAVKYLTRFNETTSYISQKLLARADAEAGQPHEDFDLFSYGLTVLERHGEEDWTIERLCTAMSLSLFSSMQTTKMTLAMVLTEIATRPECQKMLREEARTVIAEKGWTMEALDSMWVLDSFFRETRRTRPFTDIVLNRMVLKPTTLSDGTHLTPGTYVSAAYAARESDPRYYPSPATFDPLRFYKLRTDRSSNRFSVTDVDSNEYLGFGAGKHACPGRFFAVAIIKTAVVQLLLEYDMTPGSDPMEFTSRFEDQRPPSSKDRVKFRKL